MTDIATGPCHEILHAITMWQKEIGPNDSSKPGPKAPVTSTSSTAKPLAQDADFEKKAAKEEEQQHQMQGHWCAPILISPLVRGSTWPVSSSQIFLFQQSGPCAT